MSSTASRPSLAGRAVLAVALLAGFYVLALAVAAGLLYAPYAGVHYLHHVNGRLALFCVVGAGIILWSVVPRPDRFVPPGPRLTEEAHPRLFALVRDVATRTGQEMPAEVYLVLDVNAWVAQRGGVMGFGSRRVMGIGLPLLQALTPGQLRAVLAHEFGHYHGGDTALGPWIYRTRAAIERTLAGLSRHSSVLTAPFHGYMQIFLRVTHAVSRRQEFVADALAARVAGREAMAGALRAIHGAGAAFTPFLYNEVEPAVARGFRPPLAAGFARFLSAAHVAAQVHRVVEREIAEDEGDPLDTHPPLRERLAALAAVAEESPSPSQNDGPATALLSDLEGTEAALLAAVVAGPGRTPARLEPVGWEEMVERVWLPGWREVYAENRQRLHGLTPAGVPRFAERPAEVAVRMGLAAYEEAAGPGHVEQAARVLGSALALVLHDAGCPGEAAPGEPIRFRLDGLEVNPFTVLDDLAAGKLGADEWARAWEATGRADLDLSRAGGTDAPVVATA